MTGFLLLGVEKSLYFLLLHNVVKLYFLALRYAQHLLWCRLLLHRMNSSCLAFVAAYSNENVLKCTGYIKNKMYNRVKMH